MYGKRFSALLKRNGMNQKRFAEISGIHRVTVNRWTKSAHLWTDTIETICGTLGIPVWQFFVTENDLAQYYQVDELSLSIIRRVESLPVDKQAQVWALFSAALDLL